MSLIRLVITAAPRIDDAVIASLHIDGQPVGEPTQVSIPVQALSRTVAETATARAESSRVADAIQDYADVLRTALRPVSGDHTSLTPSDDVVVLVAGPPLVHRWLWESLAASSTPRGRLLVAHLPEIDGTVYVPADRAVLAWIGARVPGGEDIPRYHVLGRVARNLLRRSSAVDLGGVRTDSTVDDLVKLVEALRGDDRYTCCHIDAHGRSVVRAGTGEQIVQGDLELVLRAEKGAVLLTGDAVAELLAACDVDLFSTNACFGAQHRVLGEYPFPGRVVAEGRRAAIAARHPLMADVARAYFDRLYGTLAAGGSLAEAHRRGLGVIGALASTDIAARSAVQLTLWVRSAEELNRSFEAGDDEEPDSWAGEHVAATVHGGSLSAVAESFEDAAWEGGFAELVAAPHCELSADALSNLTVALRAVARPPVMAVNLGAEPVQVALPALEEPERSELLKWFAGPSAIRQLLIELVPGDPAYLSALRRSSGGDATLALLDALRWGEGAGHVPPERSFQASAVYAELRGLATETARVTADQEGNPEGWQLEDRISQGRVALDLALPMLASHDNLLFGTPVPRLFVPRGARGLVETFGDVGTFAVNGDDVYVQPDPWTQLAIRGSVPPEEVVLARLTLDPVHGNEGARWNAGTRRATLGWLAIAVAFRQLGHIDLPSLGRAAIGVATLNRKAAGQLLEVIQIGRPGDAELGDKALSDYQGLLDVWRGFDHSVDDTGALASAEVTTERALALLHTERPGEALAITLQLLKVELDEVERIDALTAHAYALARTGGMAGALEVAASLVPTLPRLSLYDQCELLHLLGDLADRRGRKELAARYLLEERRLNSPALHRRLHNRRHLYTVLRERHPITDELVIQTCAEGLDLAHEAANVDDQRYFADVLAEAAFLTENSPLRERLLASAAGNEPVRSLPGIELLAALDDDIDRGLKRLRQLAAGTDKVAARACLALAEISDAVHERVAILRRGAEVGDPTYAALCSRMLITAMWEASDYEGLEIVAHEVLALHPSFAEANFALARVADARGDPESATEHLARAFAYQQRPILGRHGPLDMGSLLIAPEEASKRTMLLLSEHVRDLNERGLQSADATLPGLSLIEALDLIAGYNVNAFVPETVAALLWASERAWDRHDLDAAIVARHHAVDILRRGGEEHRFELAIELGWLATLLKQSERLGDAELLYQQAIALGTGVVTPESLSSLIGRYGNQLHYTGSYRAAAETQWRAVGVRTGRDDPFPPSPEALKAALAYEEPEPEWRSSWLLLMCNLANCLKDAGFPTLAVLVIRHAAPLLASPHVDERDSNVRHSRRLLAFLMEELVGIEPPGS